MEIELTLVYPDSSIEKTTWPCVPRQGEGVNIGDKRYAVANVIHHIDLEVRVYLNNL